MVNAREAPSPLSSLFNRSVTSLLRHQSPSIYGKRHAGPVCRIREGRSSVSPDAGNAQRVQNIQTSKNERARRKCRKLNARRKL